jgi:hypothetical protein
MARRIARSATPEGVPKTDSEPRKVPSGSRRAANGTAVEVKRAPPTREQIAARAYQIFLARGGAHGRHEEDWLRAEQELRNTDADTRQRRRGWATGELAGAERRSGATAASTSRTRSIAPPAAPGRASNLQISLPSGVSW